MKLASYLSQSEVSDKPIGINHRNLFNAQIEPIKPIANDFTASKQCLTLLRSSLTLFDESTLNYSQIADRFN